MIHQTTVLAPLARRRRKGLSDKQVAALPRKAKRYILADPEQRGLYLRIPVQGPIVYAAVARYQGKQTWATVGTNDVLTIEEARDKAREAIKRIKAGEEPFPPPPAKPAKPDSVEAVVEDWLKRHVEKNKLITGPELARRLRVYVFPYIGDRPFAEIRRGDIAKLLDTVEDKHGAWVADSVLGILRSVSTWFASRNDDYQIPFVRGQRRVPAHDRKRSRILNDDELRAVWRTADELTAAEQAALADDEAEPVTGAAFGRFVQLSLLLAQRREKLATMRWDDISADGSWTIPTSPREKGTGGKLKLPPLALDIIAKQKHLASNPHVFPGRGSGPIRGFSALKAAFDKTSGVGGYSLHDLRRTARSLMSRAGVQSEHAERVLGHARPGVEGTYDRHDYAPEKAMALGKLAALIETIVNRRFIMFTVTSY